MFTFLLIIHILICFLLIIVILLQAGKGGGLASAFGGSGTSDVAFGGRQAAGFLGKATMVLGIMFGVFSFGLALFSSYSEGPRSVVQEQLQTTTSPMPVGAPAPVAQPADNGSGLLEGVEDQSQEAGAQEQPVSPQ